MPGAIFSEVLYPEMLGLFPKFFQFGPNTPNTTQVDLGRVVASSFEIASANNAFTQEGTISTFKTPLNCVDDPEISGVGSIGTSTLAIQGATALVPVVVSTGAYLNFVKEGAYAVSMSRTGGAGDFAFKPMFDNVQLGTDIKAQADFGGTPGTLNFKSAPIFWDNDYDTICSKISTGGTAQTFVIKRYLTVEFSTVYGSFLHSISQPPPPRDASAFRVYGAIQDNLPAAVPAKDNPNFWNTVVGLAKGVTGVASLLPGPIGMAASGVHAVTSALEGPRNNLMRKPAKQPTRPTKSRTQPKKKPKSKAKPKNKSKRR